MNPFEITEIFIHLGIFLDLESLDCLFFVNKRLNNLSVLLNQSTKQKIAKHRDLVKHLSKWFENYIIIFPRDQEVCKYLGIPRDSCYIRVFRDKISLRLNSGFSKTKVYTFDCKDHLCMFIHRILEFDITFEKCT